MAEYIERGALLEKAERGIVAAIDVLYAPAADVSSVVHGEWVHDGDGDWRCSSCRRLFTFDDYGDVHPIDDCWFNYCPNCGARMDGE